MLLVWWASPGYWCWSITLAVWRREIWMSGRWRWISSVRIGRRCLLTGTWLTVVIATLISRWRCIDWLLLLWWAWARGSRLRAGRRIPTGWLILLSGWWITLLSRLSGVATWGCWWSRRLAIATGPRTRATVSIAHRRWRSSCILRIWAWWLTAWWGTIHL